MWAEMREQRVMEMRRKMGQRELETKEPFCIDFVHVTRFCGWQPPLGGAAVNERAQTVEEVGL